MGKWQGRGNGRGLMKKTMAKKNHEKILYEKKGGEKRYQKSAVSRAR